MENPKNEILETPSVAEAKPETAVLADMLVFTRQLTRFYLSQLKDVDPSKRFTIGDFTTNSVHWIVAHLAWATDYLVIKGTGNESLNLPWFKLFEIGQPYPSPEHFPPYAEAYAAFKETHEKAIEIIRALSESTLAEPNAIGVTFGTDSSVRMIIQHASRHENTHIGHLTWLLRMHGRKGI